MAAFRIIRRQRSFREITAPELARYYIHIALHAVILRFGVSHYLVGAHAGIEDEFEFSIEFVASQMPVAGSTRHEGAFQKLLIILKGGDNRFRRGFELRQLRRRSGKLKDFPLIE